MPSVSKVPRSPRPNFPKVLCVQVMKPGFKPPTKKAYSFMSEVHLKQVQRVVAAQTTNKAAYLGKDFHVNPHCVTDTNIFRKIRIKLEAAEVPIEYHGPGESFIDEKHGVLHVFNDGKFVIPCQC
jgi:hypothetical protein